MKTNKLNLEGSISQKEFNNFVVSIGEKQEDDKSNDSRMESIVDYIKRIYSTNRL